MALRFYRGLAHPVRALSFDLDDTLYENEPVIQKAEQAQFEAICAHLPSAREAGLDFWRELKWSILKSSSDLYHDASAWRQAVIRRGLQILGVDESELPELAQHVYQVFYDARSDFQVPQQTIAVLKQLAKRYPLVAVTNGNADINRIGLAPYFIGYYRAGAQGTRSKPYPDMLQLAARQLDLSPREILHIGDSESSDVRGALNANCMSLWYNPNKKAIGVGQKLADGEFSNLDDLLHLL